MRACLIGQQCLAKVIHKGRVVRHGGGQSLRVGCRIDIN
jgi:hypothetical protein